MWADSNDHDSDDLMMTNRVETCKDLLKKQFYIEKGYKWFEISEREFTNRKKLLKDINQLL